MTKIQEIIREYFENLYSNKLENLEEINKFLDTYDFPKVNQKTIMNNEIENLATARYQWLMPVIKR
jgi:hypothetical protein